MSNKALVKELRRELNAANRTIKLERKQLRGFRPSGGKSVAAARTANKATQARLTPKSTFDDYLAILADPENGEVPDDLQVPGLLQCPTVAWRNKWIISVTADLNGEAIVLFRPGIAATFAATGWTIRDYDGGTGLHPYLSSDTGGQVFKSFPPVGQDTVHRFTSGVLSDTWGVTYWNPCPEAASMIESFVAYQPIAASIRAQYTAAAVAATGRCVLASIPGSQTIPLDNPLSANTMGLGNYQVLDFDSLATLLDARTSSVLEPGHVVYIPEGQSAARFRPTKSQPPLAADYWGSAILGVDNLPCCDSEPSVFMATANAYANPSNLNDFLFATGSVTPRPATEQMLISSHLQQKLAAAGSPDSPVLVFFAEGLVAGANFQITFSQVLCGISDTRAWSLSRPHALRSLAPSNSELAALVAAQSIPRAIPFKAHGSFLKSIAKAAQQVYHKLEGTAGFIKKHGPNLARGASFLANKLDMPEVAGFLDSVGGATSLAEVADLLLV